MLFSYFAFKVRLLKKYHFQILIFVIAVSVGWVNFNQQRWVSQDVIRHDITSYYAYLPALFYEHDLTLSFVDDSVRTHNEYWLYAPNRTPAGKPVIKMSMGMAVTYLPFFAMAHVYCKVADVPADGFSPPYHFAVLFSSLVYYIFGLVILRRLLLRFFSQRITTVTLFTLTFATNIFYYLTMAGGLSHIADFAGIAAFLYCTVVWNEHPTARYALLIGLAGGLVTLIRPVNGLIFVFFAIYTIASQLRNRRAPLLHIVLVAASAIFVVLPQLVYWKYVTGHYLFNSYVGEYFYFGSPRFADGMFGFRKGWLIYTPVMAFAVAGFIFLRGPLKRFLFPAAVFVLAYVYVVLSWWCWWYGGSFGQRALIDIYPLLSIPLTAFFTRAATWDMRRRRTVYLMTGFFTLLNLFQSMQAKYNIIHYDSMTFRAYLKVFGATSKPLDIEQYLDHPDYEKARKGER